MVTSLSTTASRRSASAQRAVSGHIFHRPVFVLVSYQPAIVLFAGFVINPGATSVGLAGAPRRRT
jgi:hypothetical protein